MRTSQTFVSIPIHSDPRTFEEERKDLLENLEKRYTHTSHSRTTMSSSTSTSTLGGSQPQVSFNKSPDDWDKDVNQWIQERRAKWNEEVKQMKENFFRLESGGGNFGGNSSSGWNSRGFDDMPSKLSSQMNDSHSFSKTTTTTTRSSSSTNVNQRGTSNMGNGVSTTTSRQENNVSTNTSLNDFSTFPGMQQRMMMPDLMEDQGRFNDNKTSLSCVENMFELGDDGQMHFKVRFDVTDFQPEDIQVTTTNNMLTVKAKMEKKTATSCSMREMSRSVELPDRVDHDKLQCHLTKDGVLVADAPLLAPQYKPVTIDSEIEFGMKPKSGPSKLQLTGRSGVQIISESSSQRKAHVEVPVDSLYQPSDISVNVEGRKIHIKGVHEESSGGRKSRQEFSRTVEVSATLDSSRVDSELQDGVLIVEVTITC